MTELRVQINGETEKAVQQLLDSLAELEFPSLQHLAIRIDAPIHHLKGLDQFGPKLTTVDLSQTFVLDVPGIRANVITRAELENWR